MKKSIKNMVYTYINEKMYTILNFINSLYIKENLTSITLQGEVTGTGTIYSANNIEINAHISDNSHTHENLLLTDSSIQSFPNTAVMLDENGNMFSSGTIYGDTGYKLKNGLDISTLFIPKNNNFIVNNIEKKDANNPIISLEINNENNTITLVKNIKNGI